MGHYLKRSLLFSLSFFVLTFQQLAFSSVYFENLKNDQSVPEHCRETELSDFDVQDLGVFTVTIENNRPSSRFTFAYPMKRANANFLWKTMKHLVKNGFVNPRDLKHIRSDKELYRDFLILKENYKQRGFLFHSEGEVLELLSHIALQKTFDEAGENLFVTGSLEYREFKNSSVMGELDVVIADKTTCKVLAYGEAKLGAHRSSKAWSQVRRFIGFLKSKDLIPRVSEVEQSWMKRGSLLAL